MHLAECLRNMSKDLETKQFPLMEWAELYASECIL